MTCIVSIHKIIRTYIFVCMYDQYGDPQKNTIIHFKLNPTVNAVYLSIFFPDSTSRKLVNL